MGAVGDQADSAAEGGVIAAAVSASIDLPASPIVFVQIPEAVGPGFANYLKANCEAPDDAVLAGEGDGVAAAAGRAAPVIAACTPFRDFAPAYPDARFVTWLRHPVERVVGQYAAWRSLKLRRGAAESVPEMYAETVRFARRATLDEFVLSDCPVLATRLCNVATGALSSEPYKSERFLASAKENLVRRFWFFGMADRFDASMRLFRHSLGWRVGLRDDGGLAGRKGATLGLRAAERLMELNRLDSELFAYARLVFEDRVRWADAEGAGRAA